MLKGLAIVGGLSRKAGKIFSRIPITPNCWTAISIIFALFGAVWIVLGNAFAAALLFAISFFCDFVDGAVARERGQTSRLGAYIDGMSDRVVEFFLLAGLLFYPLPEIIFPAYFWLFCLLFFGTCMTTFAKAYADHRKAISAKDVEGLNGFFRRGERAAVLFLVLVMLPIDAEISIYLLILAGVLSALTVAQEFLYVVEKSRKNR